MRLLLHNYLITLIGMHAVDSNRKIVSSANVDFYVDDVSLLNFSCAIFSLSLKWSLFQRMITILTSCLIFLFWLACWFFNRSMHKICTYIRMSAEVYISLAILWKMNYIEWRNLAFSFWMVLRIRSDNDSLHNLIHVVEPKVPQTICWLFLTAYSFTQ